MTTVPEQRRPEHLDGCVGNRPNDCPGCEWDRAVRASEWMRRVWEAKERSLDRQRGSQRGEDKRDTERSGWQ